MHLITEYLLSFNYRICDLQFNVTPPPTVTTTSAPDDVYSTSELSLVIDKADSIEEKDESGEIEESSYVAFHTKKTFSCDDIVIEEELPATLESESLNERKMSVVTIEERKIFDLKDSQIKQQPIEASHLPPTTASTQTVPTDEFPEVFVASTIINQINDVEVNAQLDVEAQQDIKVAQEIDSLASEMRKSCTRSMNEYDQSSGVCDETSKLCSVISKASDDQRLHLRSHQQSQEDDYEVAMVSELVPGCVAPAPTPAPSIAPLAEIEVDTAEDDVDNVTEQFESVEPKPEVERKKKRKEKKEKESGESHSQAQAEAESSNDPEKSKRNAVCPWEDE